MQRLSSEGMPTYISSAEYDLIKRRGSYVLELLGSRKPKRKQQVDSDTEVTFT
jgi:hypothetical protein